jgi:uncharacterized membrane protein YgaE (UPF0421/DUF939 family)
MSERIKSLLMYSAQCVVGTLIVFMLSLFFNYKDTTWCLISVLLVLSPDGKDSFQLSLTRIKANVAGVSAGLLCLLISPANMWTLSLAIFITLSICYLFKLDAGIRSALAATIIVMLHEEGSYLWVTALERVISVFVGCILGLLITFVFYFRIHTGEKKDNGEEA